MSYVWIFLLVLCAIAGFIYPSVQVRHLKCIPGSVIVGNLTEFTTKGHLESIWDWTNKFGSFSVFRIGRLPVVIVSDADSVREILSTKFGLRPLLIPSILPLSKNLLFASDNEWKLLQLNAVFNPSKLAGFQSLFTKCSINAIESMKQSTNRESAESVDLYDLYKKMAFDVVGSAAFGQQFNTVQGENTPVTDAASTLLNDQGNKGWLLLLIGSIIKLPAILLQFFPPVAKIIKKVKILNQWTLDIINERKADPNAPHDFLKLMMEISKDTKPNKKLHSLSIAEIQANARLFMIAGHETTGASIGIALYFISKNPTVKIKLLKEIDALNDGKDVEIISYTYLDWVIKESMRMMTIAPLITRASSQNMWVSNHAIPAYTTLVIPIHHLHHNPTYWTDPHLFRPERFDPESAECINRHKFCYLPFGGGSRPCIGYKFALAEMKTAMVMLMREFDVEVDTSRTKMPLKTEFAATVRVVGGIYFHVKKR